MKKYLRLFFPVMIILIGIQFLLDHFYRNPTKITAMEQLVAEGKMVDARVLDFNDFRTNKSPNKTSYKIQYEYAVNGKEYKREEYVPIFPEQENVKIKYLPSNPNVASMHAETALAKMKENTDSSVGIFLGIVGILFGMGAFFYRWKALKAEEAAGYKKF